MEFKKIILDWFIPPGFLRLKKKYFTRQQSAQDAQTEEPTEANSLYKFKDSYKGKRCFILATGPSIKEQDLTLLRNEYCIAVSQFHLHPLINLIKPIWHVLAPCHPPFQFDTDKKIFDTLKSVYNETDDTNFFLGNTGYEFSYYNYLNKFDPDFLNRFSRKVHFVDYSEAAALDEHNFNILSTWDLTSKPFAIRTVLYSAIQLADFLGFKEIYLLGCDHDYLNDISRTENHHFYEEGKSFSDKEHLEGFSRERWFYEYYMRWKDYRLMNTYLRQKEVSVYNATNGGLLDVFPRVNYDQLF